ncbi:MAG: TIGR02221 family CRISPR-associated protein [Anaerolineae bacterium]|nr:TIGR02221 family CRISPR-associated protein [Anaerolineae bacterium]
MKVISFLGPVNYSATKYVYTTSDGERKTYATTYFTEAIAHFFPQVDQVLVFATPRVKVHPNLLALEQRLGKKMRVVEIPEGRNKNEIWRIFDSLISEVDPQDEVVFDITGSLRSLPFISFLAAAFLRAARGVKVKAVLYGAFEARDQDSHETPVFDLSSFMQMLDWINATNQFVYTGNGAYLAKLISDQGKMQHIQSLGSAGKRLREFSQAMMLCRPLEILASADKLGQVLDRAEPDLQQWAKPYALLSERINQEYASLSVPEPTAEDYIQDSLRSQFRLLVWYLEHNQVLQGVTLAREWLVTAVGWRLDKGFLLDTEARRSVERALSGLCRLGKKNEDGTIFTESCLNNDGKLLVLWSECEKLKSIYTELMLIRNDLDHAGMNKDQIPADTLNHKLKKSILPGLRNIAIMWRLKD